MEEPGVQSLGAGGRAHDRQLQGLSWETGKEMEIVFMAVYYSHVVRMTIVNKMCICYLATALVLVFCTFCFVVMVVHRLKKKIAL